MMAVKPKRVGDKSEVHNSGVKSKAIPLQAWTGPEGSRRAEAPRFQDSRHMKVVRLSQPYTPAAFTPGNIPVRG
jgi:hypothetical protein